MMKVIAFFSIVLLSLGKTGNKNQDGCSKSLQFDSRDSSKRVLINALKNGRPPVTWRDGTVTVTETVDNGSRFPLKIVPFDQRLSYSNVRSVAKINGKYIKGIAVNFGTIDRPIQVANVLAVDFEFSGRELAFILFDTKPGLSQSNVYIEIDGYLANPAGFQVKKDAFGEHLIFVSFSKEIVRKHLRIVFSGLKYFGGLCVNKFTRVVKHVPRNTSKVLIFGDSYTAGVGANGEVINYYGYRLGKLMGWNNTIISGNSGTGYVNPWKRQTYRQRINDIIDARPDAVLITGGINDLRYADAVTIGSEARKFFKQIRGSLPNCLIIVVAPFWPKSNSYPVRLKNELRLATLGIANIKFIDISQSFAIEEKSFNRRKYIATDGMHPSIEGHIRIANDLATAIASAISENNYH